MPSETIPVNRESPFQLEELFFSTTDLKGRILFGNQVFVRVSGYAADELIGRPHNIIRHPDMPRCIFRLLWDYLLKGRAIAAYVKNMAKDGSYYWVLAYVTPIPDGFLSIRLKPSGPLFEQVRTIYEKLRVVEQQAVDAGRSGAESMDAAATELQGILESLGFADYDQFMSEMLASEVLSRKTRLKRTDAPETASSNIEDDHRYRRPECSRLTLHIRRLYAMLQSSLDLEQSLNQSMQFALSFGQTLRRITLNGRICAMALGSAAVGLSEVARQINGVSNEVADEGEILSRTMSEVMGLLKSAAAEIASSDLSVEMMALFLEELRGQGTPDAGTQKNVDNLMSVIGVRLRATCNCTENAARDLAAFEKTLDHFINTIQTLDILYVCGKIECTRVHAVDFTEILRETGEAARDARQRADKLKSLVARVQARLLAESADQREGLRMVA